MANHGSIANGTEPRSPRQGRACRDLVEEAENLALAEVDEPLHISALCVALAVSERTLRKAFHKAHGLPPCRHLRMLRLSQARGALLSADCGLVTVTEIATCFGFVELGRFSVEYRKAFGESPSQTLHHPSSGRTLTVSDADSFDFAAEGVAASLP
jgi:transcriptional regulator GlxA family with amidase domain